MLTRLIMSWVLQLAPLEPRARTTEIADAIASVSDDRRDAALLTTISFYETTLGRSGVAFGACAHNCDLHCSRCHPRPLVDTARWALGVIKTGMRVCGWRGMSVVLGFFHSGACRADPFSRREARAVERLMGRP